MSLNLNTIGDQNLIRQSSLNIAGVQNSSAALSIAQIITKSQKNFLIVCPKQSNSSRFKDDLHLFLSLFQKPDSNYDLNYFPSWEISPYHKLTPSNTNRTQRLRVLGKLKENQRQNIIVTHIQALCQPSFKPQDFSEKTIIVKKNFDYDFLKVQDKIIELGYQKSELVEDPGTFTVRGGILDVYSPSQKYPIRIDFFGDTIERIRPFNPVDQKSFAEQELLQVSLLPIREINIDRKNLQETRLRIREFADHQEFPRSSRDQIMKQLSENIITQEMDYLIPFFNKECGFLPEFMPDGFSWVWLDEQDCHKQYEETLEKFKISASELISKQEICATPENLLKQPRDIIKTSNHTQIINLSKIHIENDKSSFQTTLKCESTKQLFPKIQNKQTQDLDSIAKQIRELISHKNKIFFIANSQSQLERFAYLLAQRDINSSIFEDEEKYSQINNYSEPKLILGNIFEGFQLVSEKIIFISEDDIFGSKLHKKNKTVANNFFSGTTLDDLNEGDLLVHSDHGIGKYRGLIKLKPGGVEGDYVFIEYFGADKLYLPIYRLDIIQKYIGTGSSSPQLNKLGSQQFEKAKSKAKGAIKEIAAKLIQMYAQRHSQSGFKYSEPDEDYAKFEASFPFDETPDQLKAIQETIADMCSAKKMDRLVCGDVGYGKTEVAMRAAFKAALDLKQVAVVVPTTILAEQHSQNFKKRFEDYNITIDSLSRFRTKKEQKEIIEKLKAGKIDIIIGTHRLFSKDINFHDLGLIILDEEQRFGVEHKEKLKEFKISTDVLTLTATPIPRTLHMSLTGMKDISIITTPPADRLSIKTHIATYDDDVIKNAIKFELSRGGQVFFIHNRVQSLPSILRSLKEMIPKLRIGMGHGQMPEKDLEKVMLGFYQKKYDILLCTSIIENGLDVPNANTIIVNRADNFGLSQLYQIRGRVGRSKIRAHAYFLLPEDKTITHEAQKRLQVLQRHVELGSGFAIASHDLEIRGGGDILGASQSGHVTQVGYDMYLTLLDEEIARLKGTKTEQKQIDIEINSPYPAFLPESFVRDTRSRLSLYKRLSEVDSEELLKEIKMELEDRYGNIPSEANGLLWLIRIKIVLRRYGFISAQITKNKLSLKASENPSIDLSKLMQLIGMNPGKYQLSPDSKIIVSTDISSLEEALTSISDLVRQITSI